MLPIIADEVYEYAVSMQVIQFTSFSRNYSIHRNRIKWYVKQGFFLFFFLSFNFMEGSE